MSLFIEPKSFVSSVDTNSNHDANINHVEESTTDEYLNTGTPSHLTHFWLGLSRKECLAIANRHKYKVTSFAQWMYFSEHNIILSFEHQQCIKVGTIV